MTVEQIDGDYYITVDHPMEKGHFLSFAAYVKSERLYFIRLYPEHESFVPVPRSTRRNTVPVLYPARFDALS